MLKILYMGTPDFSVEPLKKLLENTDKYQVVAVATNNDKPVGRKQVLTPSPVSLVATENNIEVLKYDKIRLEGVEDVKRVNPDVIITCAFGQILSQEIIDIPKYGVINIHASILPKYRGASPVHYAILNGEKEVGVTIMKTDIGIDTGDILYVKKTAVNDGETCGSLMDRLSKLGAEAIIESLDAIISGEVKPIKQDDSMSTYTSIIKKQHALIDWTKSADEIYNQVRAFNPAPIAYTFLDGEMLKIYQVKVVDGIGGCGEVIKNDKSLVVGTGCGAIEICLLQKAGGKMMNVSDFLKGNRIELSKKLG